MLTCTERKKNSSGDIISYVFDDGSVISAKKLKSMLTQNGDLVSNLKLSVDGRVIARSKKEQARLKAQLGTVSVNNTGLDKIVSLVNKKHELTRQEFYNLYSLIIIETGLKRKLSSVLNNIADGYDVFCQLGTFICYGSWRLINVDGSKYASWKIEIYDGNASPGFGKFRVSNLRYKKGVLIDYENIYTEEQIQDGILKVKRDFLRSFDWFKAVDDLYFELRNCFDKSYDLKRELTLKFVTVGYAEYVITVRRGDIGILTLNISNYDTLTQKASKEYRVEAYTLGRKLNLSNVSLNSYINRFGKLVDELRVELIKTLLDTVTKDSSILQHVVNNVLKDQKLVWDILGCAAGEM